MIERENALEVGSPLQGMKFLKRLTPLLKALRDEGCQRDRAGNRTLHYDQLLSLVLLKFFNPLMDSLRDLNRASRLKQVRKRLGCQEASLGSLSESMQVFKSERLVEVIQSLLRQLRQRDGVDRRLANLAYVPTAVDGTLLRQLPLITQACFHSRRDRGWKLHAQFEVLRGVPIGAWLTDASGQGAAGEKAVLKRTLQPDRCYLADRGYEEFSLFNAIVAAGSSYVCRVRNDHHFTAEESRPLSAEAQAAGVLEDSLGRMGSPKSKRIAHPDHRQRRIVVRAEAHPKRGGRRPQGARHDIVLVTNLLDVPAEVIALLYHYRWLIELFFRWLKCVLGCRHLISHKANGIEIQMYCALIACLLIELTVGPDVRPNSWTYKLLCLYLQGWASKEDVLAHLRQRAAEAAAKKKS